MKHIISKAASFAMTLSLLAVPLAPALAADSTIVVTGNTSAGENQPGWLFNRDLSTATEYEFNDDAASIGVGSLYVLPIGANASDKFIAENFLNTAIADVNSISYDFMIAGSGDDADAEQFYMNVYANFGVSDDLKYYDCRYDVIATTGSTAGFTTVTFDPTLAYSVVKSGTSPVSPCPAIPTDMGAGANIRAIAITVGDTSTSDQGIGGYLDKVVVNLDSGVTTYDFEPTEVCSTITLMSDTGTQFKGMTLVDPTGSSDDNLFTGTAGTAVVAGPDGFPGAWDTASNDADVEGASWVNDIATAPNNSGGVGGDGTVNSWRLFSEAFTIPVGATVSSADLHFTADNSVEAFLDNASIGSANSYTTVVDLVLNGLTSGSHELEFVVKNDAYNGATNPTGLIYKATVEHCVPTAPASPTEKDQCKNGGWENFGFRNQGQCIRFVNTGQDSR